MQDQSGARVLVLGASGLTGGGTAAALEASSAPVNVVRASRDQATVERWRGQGRAAVYLDLDDARTFRAALEGVDLRRATLSDARAVPSFMEATYAASVLEWLQQTYDGRMDYSAVTTSTIEDLLGRPPVHLADWAIRNRDALLATQAP